MFSIFDEGLCYTHVISALNETRGSMTPHREIGPLHPHRSILFFPAAVGCWGAEGLADAPCHRFEKTSAAPCNCPFLRKPLCKHSNNHIFQSKRLPVGNPRVDGLKNGHSVPPLTQCLLPMVLPLLATASCESLKDPDTEKLS